MFAQSVQNNISAGQVKVVGKALAHGEAGKLLDVCLVLADKIDSFCFRLF